MKIFSSMHLAAVLGLTLCSGLPLVAGCAAPPEDTTTTADVGGDEDGVAAGDPADTEGENAASAQQALEVSLENTWISGWSGSAWHKWNVATSRDASTGAMVTRVWGYTCDWGASCAAGISATIRHNTSTNRIIITVSNGGSVSYVNGRYESGGLNAHGRGFVQSFFAAVDAYRVNRVGRGRSLSTASDCTAAVLHAVGASLGAVGVCGVLVSVDAVSAFLGTAGAAIACAGVVAEAGSAVAASWTPCGG